MYKELIRNTCDNLIKIRKRFFEIEKIAAKYGYKQVDLAEEDFYEAYFDRSGIYFSGEEPWQYGTRQSIDWEDLADKSDEEIEKFFKEKRDEEEERKEKLRAEEDAKNLEARRKRYQELRKEFDV